MGSSWPKLTAANAAFVGAGHGLTDKEAGPCRFPQDEENGNRTINFFAWVSSEGKGGMTVREAPRRVLNKRHYPLPTHHA